ncbi:MAG: 3'-5' exonuclease [Lentisphaeria bacterium]|nr:3'-5' exonuclease [Lentisphaeria bacterium]
MSEKSYLSLGPFTIFDVETTGFSPTNDRIIEIGAMRIDLDGTVSYFQTLVNPNRPIPFAVRRLTKITDEMVADAPHFREIGNKFLQFARNSTLVAHNAKFDLAFLQESLHRNNLQLWQGQTLDLLILMKRSHANLPSYKLQYLREVFSLEDDGENCNPHRAMSDVIWTQQLLKISLEKLLKITC